MCRVDHQGRPGFPDQLRDLTRVLPAMQYVNILRGLDQGLAILRSHADVECQSLSAAGFRVAGFLVSRHEGNPETLFGRPVLTPDEAVRPGCAVVALSRGYLEEVHSALETAQWRYWDMP